GDSNAVPFPRPLLLLGDARTLLGKWKLCPKKLCQLRGHPKNYGPIMVQQLFPSALNGRWKPSVSPSFSLLRAVTTEAAGSSPVVPAIQNHALAGSAQWGEPLR